MPIEDGHLDGVVQQTISKVYDIPIQEGARFFTENGKSMLPRNVSIIGVR